MDKYTKTINQLKKEYINLKLSNTHNKFSNNKLINGGSELGIVGDFAGWAAENGGPMLKDIVMGVSAAAPVIGANQAVTSQNITAKEARLREEPERIAKEEAEEKRLREEPERIAKEEAEEKRLREEARLKAEAKEKKNIIQIGIFPPTQGKEDEERIAKEEAEEKRLREKAKEEMEAERIAKEEAARKALVPSNIIEYESESDTRSTDTTLQSINTDQIIQSFLNTESKSEFDRAVTYSSDTNLTLEKIKNISNFIEHGEIIKRWFNEKEIDIRNTTISDLVKYFEESNKNSNRKEYSQFINFNKKYEENKYIINFKKLITKILEQQNFKPDLRKIYKGANPWSIKISENTCNRSQLGPCASVPTINPTIKDIIL